MSVKPDAICHCLVKHPSQPIHGLPPEVHKFIDAVNSRGSGLVCNAYAARDKYWFYGQLSEIVMHQTIRKTANVNGKFTFWRMTQNRFPPWIRSNLIICRIQYLAIQYRMTLKVTKIGHVYSVLFCLMHSSLFLFAQLHRCKTDLPSGIPLQAIFI